MTPPDLAGIMKRDADSSMRNALADRRALLGLLRETRAGWEAYREAQADRGHKGPHDDVLRFGDDPPTESDCAACAGAQYGTEAELVDLFDRLASLGAEP